MEPRSTGEKVGMSFVFGFLCAISCIIAKAIFGATTYTAVWLPAGIVGVVEAVKWGSGKETGSCVGTSIAWGVGLGILFGIIM